MYQGRIEPPNFVVLLIVTIPGQLYIMGVYTLVCHLCSHWDAEQEKLLSVNQSHSTERHHDSNTVATVSNSCVVSHSVSQPFHNQDTNTCSPSKTAFGTILLIAQDLKLFSKLYVPSQNK